MSASHFPQTQTKEKGEEKAGCVATPPPVLWTSGVSVKAYCKQCAATILPGLTACLRGAAAEQPAVCTEGAGRQCPGTVACWPWALPVGGLSHTRPAGQAAHCPPAASAANWAGLDGQQRASSIGRTGQQLLEPHPSSPAARMREAGGRWVGSSCSTSRQPSAAYSSGEGQPAQGWTGWGVRQAVGL